MIVPKLTDEDPFPYGKYKGEKMANVPAQYLLYLFENGYLNRGIDAKKVCRYVQDNLDVLVKERNGNS